MLRPVKRTRYTGILTDDGEHRASVSHHRRPALSTSQALVGSTAHDPSTNAAGGEKKEEEQKGDKETEGRGREDHKRKDEIERTVRSVAAVHARDSDHEKRSESVKDDCANDEV